MFNKEVIEEMKVGKDMKRLNEICKQMEDKIKQLLPHLPQPSQADLHKDCE
jgi:hypothetical protein